MSYLIDSDVFIEAKNRYYGFDFCPGFWNWILRQHAAGSLYSVQRIQQELVAGNDDLAVWAAAQGAQFFQTPDQATQTSLGLVSQGATGMTVNGQRYTAGAMNEFLSSGDYFLIAHAHAHAGVVVTNEYAQPQPSLRRYKIPDVCTALGVRCVTPFTMLRESGAQLII